MRRSEQQPWQLLSTPRGVEMDPITRETHDHTHAHTNPHLQWNKCLANFPKTSRSNIPHLPRRGRCRCTPPACIHEPLTHAMLVQAPQPAALELTFLDVEKRSNQVAFWSLNCGLAKGDALAIFMANRPEFVVLWLRACEDKLSFCKSPRRHVRGRAI
jgi:non-ribosomal peptide synthetase component F